MKTEQVRYIWLEQFDRYESDTKSKILNNNYYEVLDRESPCINPQLAFKKQNWTEYWEDEYYDS